MTNYAISSWPEVHYDLQRKEMISYNWNIQSEWKSDGRSLLRSPATDACICSCYIPSISCPSAPGLLSAAKGHHVPRPAAAPTRPDDLTQLWASREVFGSLPVRGLPKALPHSLVLYLSAPSQSPSIKWSPLVSTEKNNKGHSMRLYNVSFPYRSVSDLFSKEEMLLSFQVLWNPPPSATKHSSLQFCFLFSSQPLLPKNKAKQKTKKKKKISLFLKLRKEYLASSSSSTPLCLLFHLKFAWWAMLPKSLICASLYFIPMVSW